MVEAGGKALIVGGVTSSTLIVCVAVAVLPQSSVAVHVRVIENEPAQAPGVVTSLKVSSTSASHRSVAVGVVHDGVASQLMVEAGGKALIVGGVTSSTLIVCVAVAVLPQSSVAVHVRVIENEPAQAPGVVTSLKVSSTSASHRSVAVGVVHDGVASQLMVVAPGSVEITGGVTSSTLIVCVAVAVLPQSSVAVHVRVIENEPAQAPGVVTSLKVSSTSASHRSVAVGVVHDGVASQLMVEAGGKALIVGGVTSSTLIVRSEERRVGK